VRTFLPHRQYVIASGLSYINSNN